jgi:hypothetical protein
VPLSEICRLVDDDVGVEQLRGILRLRQAEVRAQLTQMEQLTRVETRHAQLEEGPMAEFEVIVKRLEPVRVVALSEDLAGVRGDRRGLWPYVPTAARRAGVSRRGVPWVVPGPVRRHR